MAYIEKSVIGAVDMLLNNRRLGGYDHTPPSWSHYPHCFLWDSGFISMVYSFYGRPDDGAQELLTVFKGQNPDTGFIPNMRFSNRGRLFDPERYTFLHPFFGSDYTQPPILALSAWNIYESYKAKGEETKGLKFLSQTYDNLFKLYHYFYQYRRNSADDYLIGVIHPHETGRDSDHTFDFSKLRFPSNGDATPLPVALLNTATDYLSSLALNVRLRIASWDPIKAKEIFWVNDVMFNVIYADNLRVMAQIAEVLGRSVHSRFFNNQAKRVEEAILKDLWSEEDGMFYARKKDGFIEKVSVSNLFPIALENIGVGQLKNLLDLLEDETFFATDYPIPSNPVGLAEHDHSYKEKRIWRGPTWINMNYYIVRGLLKQAKRFKDRDKDLTFRCASIAKHIAEKSHELIEKSGRREFYNPNTGQGYRVSNFGWSTLADLMPEYVEKELQSIFNSD